MTALNKETKGALLGAVRLKREAVAVPEWGDGVVLLVSEMSGAARDSFYAARVGDGKTPVSETQAELIIAATVDDNGEPVFTRDDVPQLRAQSSALLDRISGVAMRLNGMAPTAVEDAAKNSEAAQSGDSGSVSA